MSTNPPQLFLLADHIKLSLLERQRAVSLNLPSHSQDSQISRSLEQLRSGIESLESQVEDIADEYDKSSLLSQERADDYQVHHIAAPTSAHPAQRALLAILLIHIQHLSHCHTTKRPSSLRRLRSRQVQAAQCVQKRAL